jgi:hypothetical protein
LHNRYAYKPLTLATDLRNDFKNHPEAMDWLRQNATALSEVEVLRETDLTAARYAYTPEHLTETGQEYRLGIFCVQEDE